MNNDNKGTFYTETIMRISEQPVNFGRMNAPTASAYIKGPCGDEMEFYLVIENRVIKDVKFYTEGCVSTRVCGEIAAELVKEKDVESALNISPRKIIDQLKGLPESDMHCSILAVSTLYKAIADYLLKP